MMSLPLLPRIVDRSSPTVARLYVTPLDRGDVGSLLPRDAPAVPTGAVVRIGTPAVPLPAPGTTQAATLDTASGTVQPAASAGAKTLTLSGTVAITRGHHYLVTLASGERFVVEAAASGTSTLRTMRPIPCDVPHGSTVQGITAYVDVSEAQRATEGEGVAIWSFAYGSDVYRELAQPFRVVRRVPQWHLTADTLVELMPDVERLRDRGDDDLGSLLSAGLHAHLLPRLRAKGIREERIASATPLTYPHAVACRLVVALNDPTASIEERRYWATELDRAVDLALVDVNGWVDAPERTDPVPGDRPQRTSSIRWTR